MSSGKESSTPPSTKDSIVIVTAGDEGFAMPMAVTLYSALTNLPADQSVEIVVLDSGISEKSRRRIADVVSRASSAAEISWVTPDISSIEQIDVEMAPRFNKTTFYRFLIPDVLPETCERVLYLDGDIVVERNLQEMWEEPFEGNTILAVPERLVSCPRSGVAEWERLNLDEGAYYFNAGMMLINLPAWREREVSSKAIEYLLNPNNQFRFSGGDQEALNAVLPGQWRPLDLRWNVTHLLYDAEEKPQMEAQLQTDLDPVAQDPFMIHYTAHKKPWGDDCQHPYEHRFHDYLRQSGWFGPGRYPLWRIGLAMRRVLHTLKEETRPFRHVLGIRRRSWRS